MTIFNVVTLLGNPSYDRIGTIVREYRSHLSYRHEFHQPIVRSSFREKNFLEI